MGEIDEEKTSKNDHDSVPSIVDHTNLKKLNQNLKRCIAEQKDSGERYTFAVLLTTGALNPVHLGHVDVMECAKIQIEKMNAKTKVIAGFMSPSHDSYLQGKYGKNKFIPAQFRCKMVSLATAHSDWLSVDEWECRQKDFVDFPSVAKRMLNQLRQTYCDELKCIDESRLLVYYCCGLDHAHKCNLLSGSLHRHGVGTLVVRRPSGDLKRVKLKSNAKKMVLVVDAPPVEFDRSSTIVRKLLLRNQTKWKELEKYVHPEVIQYLKSDPDSVI